MSEIIYRDSDGREQTLNRLCANEPDWAANRIRVGLARITELEAEVERLTIETSGDKTRRIYVDKLRTRAEEAERERDEIQVAHNMLRRKDEATGVYIATLKRQRDELAAALEKIANPPSGEWVNVYAEDVATDALATLPAAPLTPTEARKAAIEILENAEQSRVADAEPCNFDSDHRDGCMCSWCQVPSPPGGGDSESEIEQTTREATDGIL